MDTDDAYVTERNRMVDSLEQRGYISRPSTTESMRAVPRHEFVPTDQQDVAYEDRPLPIGTGQTISAPHMVAMMTDLLELEPGERVLEIGTGCGYHAAVTAEIVGAEEVYSVEYYQQLANDAERRLERLGYGAISIHVGDGHTGWATHAPYDACYLTCAAERIPDALVEQVRPGGRLLGPVGDHAQELVLVHIDDAGIADREHHGGVRFVPMREGGAS